MQPSEAQEPNATRICDLRRSQVSDFLVFFVADAAVEEGQQDGFIRHGFDIFILGIHGNRPENDFEIGIYIQDFLTDVQTAISQPPQDAAQYIANFGLPLAVMLSPPPVETPRHAVVAVPRFPCGQFSGPSFWISSTNVVISWANLTPSAALAHTSLSRSGSMPMPAQNTLEQQKAPQHLVILFDVMAFSRVAAGDQDAIGAAGEGFKHKSWI